MSEWKEYKLGELLNFGNGKIRPRNPGNIPVYGGNGILDYTDSFNYNDKTIVIGRVGAYCGSIFYYDGQIWVSDNALAVKPKTGFDVKFLYYFLLNLNLNSFAEGSSHPLITQSLLNSIDVYTTENLVEQKGIATILSSIDDKVGLLYRQIKTLEDLAETMFNQWFVEEADESWREAVFSEHTEVFRGLSYKGSGLAVEGNGIPMHNLNSVYEGGGYKYEGIKYYNGEYRDRHIIKPGELIVTNTEQGHDHKLIGCPAVVPHSFGEFGLFSQHIYKLSILPNTYLTAQFFYYLLMSPRVREQVTGATNGSTVNMLAIDGLQITRFNLPPKDKVAQFSQLVSDFWQKKEKNYEQIQTLTALRDNLLPKLMSGELKVNI